MIQAVITPNRAAIFAVLALVFYGIVAAFLPPLILREVFNSLAWGGALIITITWLPAAWKAVRENADSGEWQLILAIFIVWAVVTMQRTYVIAFNWMGRPDGWANSAVAGFWPYSYMIAAMLFLSAPGVKGGKLESRSIWSMIIAVGIGCLLAGFLLGASISTSS